MDDYTSATIASTNIHKVIIKERYKLCAINLFVSVFTLLLIKLGGLQESYGFMMAYAIWSNIIIISLTASELRFNGLNILLLYLLGVLLKNTLPSFSIAQDCIDGVKFSHFYEYTDYLFPCTVGMNIYYSLFIMAYSKFSKGEILNINLPATLTMIKPFPFFLGLYIVGFIARLIPEVLQLISATLYTMLTSLGMMIPLLLALYCGQKYSKRLHSLLVVFIIIEVLYAIFFDFYKGKIVMPMAFYLIYLYLYSRTNNKKFLSKKMIVLVVFLGVFILGFVYPFMNEKRIVSQWDASTNTTNASYSNMEIISNVFSGESSKFYSDSSNKSESDGLTDRLAALPANAYFYKMADKDGHNPDFLKNAVLLKLPTVIFNKKTLDMNPGFMAYSYMINGTPDAKILLWYSSNYLGNFGGSYMWGGWLAVILMSFINAGAIVWLWRFTMKNIQNLFSWLILYSIIWGMFSCFEENNHDGGFALIISFFINVFFVLITNFLFKRKLAKK